VVTLFIDTVNPGVAAVSWLVKSLIVWLYAFSPLLPPAASHMLTALGTVPPATCWYAVMACWACDGSGIFS
jgi:hypothetical protein